MVAQVDFAGQFLPQHMAELKQRGYLTVINNRPDDEEAGQPTSAQIEAAARKQGLTYIFQPVVSGQISEYDIEVFARHYHEAHKPIMMFCRSGARSQSLFETAKQMGLLDADQH